MLEIQTKNLDPNCGDAKNCIIGITNADICNSLPSKLVYAQDDINADNTRDLLLFNTCPKCGCKINLQISREHIERLSFKLKSLE